MLLYWDSAPLAILQKVQEGEEIGKKAVLELVLVLQSVFQRAFIQHIQERKMRDKPLWLWIVVVIGVGVVKAHLHMLRMIMLMGMGLGGMYMLHILAQDFNKIRNSFKPMNGGRLLGFGLSKRSIDEVDPKQWVKERLVNETQEFPHILDNDPIGCARKYVCHISGKSKSKRTQTQNNVLTLLRAFQWLDRSGDWKKAESLGKLKGKAGECEKAFRKCIFSGAQLERFMSIF